MRNNKLGNQPAENIKTYLTKKGFDNLALELKELVTNLRPKLVEVVAWAASNGDRSENGDYIYGKRKLREYDKRIAFLTKILRFSVVVNPAEQTQKDKVYFGATVSYENDQGVAKTLQIVGTEEANINQGLLNYKSPLAQNLLKKNLGDEFVFKTINGEEKLEIVKIEYI